MSILSELEIYKLLQDGESIKRISIKYNISRNKVRRVRDCTKIYINLRDGSECLYTKNISIEKQIFYLIMQYTQLNEKDLLDEFCLDKGTLLRWKRDEHRLVEPHIYADRDNLLKKYREMEVEKKMEITPRNKFSKPSVNKSGIYLLYKSDSLQYVGKTINLQQRMLQHSNQSHVEGLEGIYSVKFINIPNNIDLGIAEKILITYLKPPLNKMMYTEESVGGLFSDTLELIPSEYSFEINVR